MRMRELAVGDVPVRALSSGMVARLGFAIATDTNPDILILDEVLSVGDESFRNKSRRRIESMWHDHVTVLLVSHDLQFIRESCSRAIWMQPAGSSRTGRRATSSTPICARSTLRPKNGWRGPEPAWLRNGCGPACGPGPQRCPRCHG